jgi:hypothetical protein
VDHLGEYLTPSGAFARVGKPLPEEGASSPHARSCSCPVPPSSPTPSYSASLARSDARGLEVAGHATHEERCRRAMALGPSLGHGPSATEHRAERERYAASSAVCYLSLLSSLRPRNRALSEDSGHSDGSRVAVGTPRVPLRRPNHCPPSGKAQCPPLPGDARRYSTFFLGTASDGTSLPPPPCKGKRPLVISEYTPREP